MMGKVFALYALHPGSIPSTPYVLFSWALPKVILEHSVRKTAVVAQKQTTKDLDVNEEKNKMRLNEMKETKAKDDCALKDDVIC